MYIQKSQKQRVILASRSRARAAILAGAGLEFEILPAEIDETSMLKELESTDLPMESRAEALAKAKAEAVARKLGDAEALILGADQILGFHDQALEAPISRRRAEMRLRDLRGARHELISGAAIFQGTSLVESLSDRASVTMRDFSDEELSVYLSRAPESALFTVGAYELEGLGARLIDHIQGDWFTALGLPLWPILRALRGLSREKSC